MALLVQKAKELVPGSTTGIQFLDPVTLISTWTLPLQPAAAREFRQLRA